MKVLLLFLVFSAAFVDCGPLSRQQSAVENERAFNILELFNTVISGLVESVKDALIKMRAEMDKLIQKEILLLAQAVKDGIDNFNQHVQQMRDQLDDLINEQIKPCLEDVRHQVNEVAERTKMEVYACGRKQLSAIQEYINKFQTINKESVKTVVKLIHACERVNDIGEKIKCAIDASREISNAIEVIRVNIATTSAEIPVKIDKAVAEYHYCISTKIQNGQQEVQEIFDKARQCLDQTETPEDTTGATEETETPENTTNVTDVTENYETTGETETSP